MWKKWLTALFLRQFRLPRDIQRYAFRRYGDRIFLQTAQRSVSYAQLKDRSYRLVQAWHDAGIRKGAIVFAQVRADRELFELRTAATEAGIILTTFHHAHSPQFILHALSQVHPALVIVDPEYGIGTAETIAQQYPSLSIWTCGEKNEYEQQLGQHLPLPSNSTLSPDDALALGFTSGTTGTPKGLISSHGAAINSLKLLINNLERAPDRSEIQINMTAIPMVGAGSGMVMPTMLSGGQLILPDDTSPAHLIKLVKKYKVTRLFLTPSQLIDLLDVPPNADQDLRTLNHIVYGTAPMPAAKLEEAIQRFGPILQQGYGQAEILPPVSMLRTTDHLHHGQIAPRHILRSSGRVVKGVQVRIVDHRGQCVSPGTIGSVQVKTPTRLKTYLDPQQNRGVILDDGFFVTGDQGYLDTEGFLHILDRQADLIKTQQGVIYPRKVEEEVHDHPAVKECCLVDVAGRPVLCLSLRQSCQSHDKTAIRSDIQSLLASRCPDWQMPAEIVFVSALPRSLLGKVLRREVRNMLITRPATP